VEPTQTLDGSDEDSRGLEPVAAQYLIIALDCVRPLTPPVRVLLDVPQAIVGRGGRRDWSRQRPAGGEGLLRIDLPDAWMSSEHARLVSERGAAGAGWILEDRGSKNGTFVNGARTDRAELRDGDVIEVGNTFLIYRALRHAGPPCDHAAGADRGPTDVPRTLHPGWSTALATLLRVARSDVPVLLLGDTGTGKEVLARAVHAASGRSGPFTAVNCGAIAQTLVESELFGVLKGSFSGATEDRRGIVRAADGGTLFLDEIAELPEPAQVALLRVLQEREVLPVGATRAVPLDLRVIGAANQDLAGRVADGRFRADLHARMSGHLVRLPPLRSRIEDVGLLVGELLPRLAGERAGGVTLSRAAARALLAHAWPYNVRELEHALRAALAIAPDGKIGLAHLPEALRAGAPPGPDAADARPVPPGDPEDSASERDRIVGALEACAGNQTQAARRLGMSRATLVNKLAIYRLPRPRKRRG